MSHDDGPSKTSETSEIAKRLGVSSTYAGQYRLRLINAEIITPAGYGKLAFTMPYLREYLRGHAAAMGLPQQSSKS